eukprot:scaffold239575_cov21-Tisochrysis_lutea.AAC.2
MQMNAWYTTMTLPPRPYYHDLNGWYDSCSCGTNIDVAYPPTNRGTDKLCRPAQNQQRKEWPQCKENMLTILHTMHLCTHLKSQRGMQPTRALKRAARIAPPPDGLHAADGQARSSIGLART